MLPFDRTFGERANELLRSPIRATATEAGGKEVGVELRLQLRKTNLGAFHETPRVQFRIDLFVAGERVEALEREERWDCPWVWSQPQAGLTALESVRRAAQDAVRTAVDSLSVMTLALEAFGQSAVRVAASIQDDVSDVLWELFELRAPEPPASAATCTPHIEAEHTLIFGPYRPDGVPSGLMELAEGPWMSFGSDAEELTDARTRRGDRMVILGERTNPYALPTLFSTGGTVFQEEPMLAPAGECSRVVVWRSSEHGYAAADMFRAQSVTRTVWFEGMMAEAVRTFMSGETPDPKERMPVPVYLCRGLVEGWWTQPKFQPPLIRELGGRFAHAALLRSDLSDAEVFAAIDSLVRLGGTVDGPLEPNHVSDDGTPIDIPLVEAARRSDAAFRHVLQHSRNSEGRIAAHARLRDHASAFVREGTWI